MTDTAAVQTLRRKLETYEQDKALANYLAALDAWEAAQRVPARPGATNTNNPDGSSA
jgi:hypothetical protein